MQIKGKLYNELEDNKCYEKKREDGKKGLGGWGRLVLGKWLWGKRRGVFAKLSKVVNIGPIVQVEFEQTIERSEWAKHVSAGREFHNKGPEMGSGLVCSRRPVWVEGRADRIREVTSIRAGGNAFQLSRKPSLRRLRMLCWRINTLCKHCIVLEKPSRADRILREIRRKTEKLRQQV